MNIRHDVEITSAPNTAILKQKAQLVLCYVCYNYIICYITLIILQKIVTYITYTQQRDVIVWIESETMPYLEITIYCSITNVFLYKFYSNTSYLWENVVMNLILLYCFLDENVLLGKCNECLEFVTCFLFFRTVTNLTIIIFAKVSAV